MPGFFCTLKLLQTLTSCPELRKHKEHVEMEGGMLMSVEGFGEDPRTRWHAERESKALN